MEIPLMNTITGFEAGITRLQDPSFFTRLLRLSHISELSEFLKFYSFWTWSALILAAVATFGSILHRTKTAFFRLRSGNSEISEPSIRFEHDPDEETCSISSESDSDDAPSTFESRKFMGEEDFRLAGSNKFDHVRRENRKLKRMEGYSAVVEDDEDCFSGGVVKLWNDFGFGFEKSSGFITMWDLNTEEILRSFLGGRGQIPAITMPSPAVVVSAGVENMRNVAMRIWDTRVGSQIPVAVAEWQPRRRRVVGIDSGGLEKVYVRDDRSSVVVRDMRNATSPLEELTESDEQTWFDADAVMVGEGEGLGYDGELTELGGGSVVSRCRNAVRSCLF